MEHTCPVCGYKGLADLPTDFEICPSCGTEFGYDDATRSHAELREKWIQDGAVWHGYGIPRPEDWNPWLQLGVDMLPIGNMYLEISRKDR